MPDTNELFQNFENHLKNGDYEASDEKLATLRKMSRSELGLIKLAMEYAHEEGYNEGQDDA